MGMPIFGVDDLGQRPIDDSWDLQAARSRWSNIDHMATYIQEQKRTYNTPPGDRLAHAPFDLHSLAAEQRQILDLYLATYKLIIEGQPVNNSSTWTEQQAPAKLTSFTQSAMNFDVSQVNITSQIPS